MTPREAPQAGRTTWPRLSIVLAAVLLLAAAAPAVPTVASAASSDGPPSWLRGTERGQHPSELDASLHDEADAADASAAPAPAEDVEIVVEASDAQAARDAVEEAGGTVGTALTDRVLAEVSADELEGVATATGVSLVREPYRPVPHGAPPVTSEGVAETGADAWHTGSFDGTGTKVAILDLGFTGYFDKQGTELPGSVETDFTRCGPGGTAHGTAVAEIVHDMAPGATLRLVCIENDVDYVSALATMAANGVDVVNGSFGFFGISRGDGSGGPSTVAGATAALRDQGILYVASSGNGGTRHYNVNATGDPTPAINFPGTSEQQFDQSLGDFVNISDGDVLEITVPAFGTGAVYMTWDAWPSTTLDFDVYIGSDTCGLVGASEQPQYPGGAAPLEVAAYENCTGSTHVLEVIVNRWAGSAAPRLDFWVQGSLSSLEHVTGGSVTDPATSPAAMAVGAYCELNGTIQTYSSRGPTIDGRVKPEISGPDATTSSVYGAQTTCNSAFTGTSAAAPHVAGAAALVLEGNPDLDVAELQQLLMDRAQDAGTAGFDNTYGSGRLRLGTSGDSFRPPPQAFTGMEPTRLLDSRPGSPQFAGEVPSNRVTPIPAGGVYSLLVRGGSTGVPADAVAVALNVTAVTPTSGGWVTVFPDGTIAPNASNLNFAAGQTIAVHVTATIGSDGRVRLFNALGNTHLVVDVAGWYGPTGDGGPSTELLTPLSSPARAMDTRGGVALGYAETAFGDRTTPVGPGQTMDVQIAGLGGVPTEATAVILNLTGIIPTANTFITAFPGGGTLPTASNLNPKKNQTVANLVVVPIGSDGEVSFFNQLGNTHMAIDVVAYFLSDSGAGYVALDPPTRNLDTRTGTGLRLGALGANSAFHLKVARYNGVPGDAAAVMSSVAAVTPTGSGWITVYPSGMSRPNASNVNFVAGGTIANAVLSRFGGLGTVAHYNSHGSTHLISDVSGYFINGENVQP